MTWTHQRKPRTAKRENEISENSASHRSIRRALQNEFREDLAEHYRWCELQDLHRDTDIYRHLSAHRYSNILPYDYNRVKLPSDSSVILNGSWIDTGYQKYILSSAPKPEAFDAWMQMFLVTLTSRADEKMGTVDIYWTNWRSARPGGFSVQVIQEEPFAVFVKRKLRIFSASPGNPKREVTQFHFQTWPDHGVASAADLVELEDAISDYSARYSPKVPILVHCSAGVGRSGTVVVIDTIVRWSARNPNRSLTEFNIREFLVQLRQQRNLCVQTAGQYELIHEVRDILEVRRANAIVNG